MSPHRPQLNEWSETGLALHIRQVNERTGNGDKFTSAGPLLPPAVPMLPPASLKPSCWFAGMIWTASETAAASSRTSSSWTTSASSTTVAASTTTWAASLRGTMAWAAGVSAMAVFVFTGADGIGWVAADSKGPSGVSSACQGTSCSFVPDPLAVDPDGVVLVLLLMGVRIFSVRTSGFFHGAPALCSYSACTIGRR